jgi:hypothetical protein
MDVILHVAEPIADHARDQFLQEVATRLSQIPESEREEARAYRVVSVCPAIHFNTFLSPSLSPSLSPFLSPSLSPSLSPFLSPFLK